MKHTQKSERAEKNEFAIESFGVGLKISCAREEVLRAVRKRIPLIFPEGYYKMIAPGKARHTISVRENKTAKYVLFRGRTKLTEGDDLEPFLKYMDWQVRLTIAEFAVDRVFLHAGVVGWKGQGIIAPAKSFQGKTTLIKELTKIGAEYYSDEYAVLDDRGYVHPFPKLLSVRSESGDYQQTDYPVEHFGGTKGTGPLPVGLILITEYEKGARFEPQFLSEGTGVMEMLSHTIPIRYNPKFSLKVLNNTVNRAIIVKTKRGEAKDFAVELLSFIENKAK